PQAPPSFPPRRSSDLAIYAAANVRIRPLHYRLDVQPQFLAATAEVFAALRLDPPEVVIADDWRGLAYAGLRSRQLAVGLADAARSEDHTSELQSPDHL